MICVFCQERPAQIGCASVDPQWVGARLMPLCNECHGTLHTSPLMARLSEFTPLPLVHSN